MLTIAVATQKGGTGKTSIVHNIGAVLAETHRVLLIDLDPQASLTQACGVFDAERRSMAQVVGGEFPLAGAVSANNIACWDPSTQTWSSLGTGVSGYVYALASMEGKLYVGGSFGGAGGVLAVNVACWDPASQTWSRPGSVIRMGVWVWAAGRAGSVRNWPARVCRPEPGRPTMAMRTICWAAVRRGRRSTSPRLFQIEAISFQPGMVTP